MRLDNKEYPQFNDIYKKDPLRLRFAISYKSGKFERPFPLLSLQGRAGSVRPYCRSMLPLYSIAAYDHNLAVISLPTRVP